MIAYRFYTIAPRFDAHTDQHHAIIFDGINRKIGETSQCNSQEAAILSAQEQIDYILDTMPRQKTPLQQELPIEGLREIVKEKEARIKELEQALGSVIEYAEAYDEIASPVFPSSMEMLLAINERRDTIRRARCILEGGT